jgi:hypothetical protein
MHALKRRQHGEEGGRKTIQSEDVARESWAMRHGAAFLAPGYVIVPELSSQGGSSAEDYTQSRTKDGTKAVSFTKTVDHPELDDMAVKAIAKARYTLYTHTARFLPGTYFVGLNEFDKLDQDPTLVEARKTAERCNKAAAIRKSERVTIIDIYRLPLDVNDERIAARVGASIRERLEFLRNSYTAENRRAYQTATVICNNMDMLVSGLQREVIRLALQASASQRPKMIAHYGGRKGVGELIRDNKGRLPDFDYGPIDNAIDMFAAR